VTEKATASSADNNRACSDGGCRKNECGSGEERGARGWGSSKKESLHYESRLEKELLCM